VGRWKRKHKPNQVILEIQPFRRLTRTEHRAIEGQVARYGGFIGLPAELLIADC
jgi:hypothetical protein